MSFTEYPICNSPFPVPLPPGWRCESGGVQVFYIDMDIYSFSVIRKKMKNNNFHLSLRYRNNFFLPKVKQNEPEVSKVASVAQCETTCCSKKCPLAKFLLGHPQPFSPVPAPISVSSLGTLSSGSHGDSASGGGGISGLERL